jgi:hypothetical protein
MLVRRDRWSIHESLDILVRSLDLRAVLICRSAPLVSKCIKLLFEGVQVIFRCVNGLLVLLVNASVEQACVSVLDGRLFPHVDDEGVHRLL